MAGASYPEARRARRSSASSSLFGGLSFVSRIPSGERASNGAAKCGLMVPLNGAALERWATAGVDHGTKLLGV